MTVRRVEEWAGTSNKRKRYAQAWSMNQRAPVCTIQLNLTTTATHPRGKAILGILLRTSVMIRNTLIQCGNSDGAAPDSASNSSGGVRVHWTMISL